MTLPTDPPGPRLRRPGDIPVEEIVAWVVRWKVALAIGAGVALRLVGYFSGRGLWMDESSLALNIRSSTPMGFFGPLENQQLATPGFLVAVWTSTRLFGGNLYALRLVPLAGGIAGLFLFRAVARRVLPDRAVFPAVLMFAVANDPVYFASELKQYSTDLASGLACLLAALTVGSNARVWSWRTTALVATGGVAILWFSHASAFVLAGIGLVGMARVVGRRDGRGVVHWAIVGASWLISLAGVHAVAIRQLAGSDQMWRFWDFAFPPIPPRSVWDATWFARRLAYYFVNPLNFDAPFDERISMLPAIGLALLGAWRLWTIDRTRWALLMLPVAMTLLAASLHFYPFHGRLVLFLAPIPLIAIAAGLDAVRERSRGKRVIYYALATMVLVVPTLAAVKQVVEPWTIHNYLGDLHPYDINPYKFPL